MNENVYEDKLFENYREWLNDGFSADVAAYEYMKRNPYFIETVNFFDKQIIELRDDEEKSEELVFVLEQLKLTMQRLFLYTGIDVIKQHKIYSGGLPEFHTTLRQFSFNIQHFSNYPNEDYNYN